MSVGAFRVYFGPEKMIKSLVKVVLLVMYCFLMEKREKLYNDKEIFQISKLISQFSRFQSFMTHLVTECI